MKPFSPLSRNIVHTRVVVLGFEVILKQQWRLSCKRIRQWRHIFFSLTSNPSKTTRVWTIFREKGKMVSYMCPFNRLYFIHRDPIEMYPFCLGLYLVEIQNSLKISIRAHKWQKLEVDLLGKRNMSCPCHRTDRIKGVSLLLCKIWGNFIKSDINYHVHVNTFLLEIRTLGQSWFFLNIVKNAILCVCYKSLF